MNSSNLLSEFDVSVCLIGPTSVGKTSLLCKILNTDFEIQTIQSTIVGQDNIFRIEDRTFRFIDTAGQERFNGLTQNYSRNCNIALFYYFPGGDKKDVDVFVDILDQNEVNNKILVLTKSDLEQCPKEQIQSLKEKWMCQHSVQISALTLEGIEDLEDFY
jgi:small GTP-binding protein